jgi:Cu-Zn family superoxide dismutase
MFAGLASFAAAALGCGGDDEEAEGEMIASSQGAALIIYDDPYAPMMAGMPNPIPAGARASAVAFDVDGKLRIELAVEGFTPSRVFGSHLHKLACDDEKAGGHYQNAPFPMGGMATDPMFANPDNEAWLDFQTDAAGLGAVELTLDWLPRAGEAKSIIFHHMASGTGGVSGAKLACLPIAF